ncbi:MAG: nitrogen regulatory [Firmicutes bacterium]|nr:nitrogen regulatory [Bacillota bacterium]
MSDKIKKIDIIISPGKFEDLRESLHEIGITGMTVSKVLGCGMQKGRMEYYRGNTVHTNLLHKLKVVIVVCETDMDAVIRTARKVLCTGEAGDGKIFVYDVANVIRISNGAEGIDALRYKNRICV